MYNKMMKTIIIISNKYQKNLNKLMNKLINKNLFKNKIKVRKIK